MRQLEDVSKRELVEFLSKGWLTHDGMWFYHCLQRYGIDITNELNLAAIESLAVVEAKRMMIFLEMDTETPWTFHRFKDFTDSMSDVLLPDFMRFSYDFPKENRLHAAYENGKCWAYQGVKKLGVVDRYRCGVFHRLECWFKAFGLAFRVEPEVDVCMMSGSGNCYRDYTFQF